MCFDVTAASSRSQWTLINGFFALVLLSFFLLYLPIGDFVVAHAAQKSIGWVPLRLCNSLRCFCLMHLCPSLACSNVSVIPWSMLLSVSFLSLSFIDCHFLVLCSFLSTCIFVVNLVFCHFFISMLLHIARESVCEFDGKKVLGSVSPTIIQNVLSTSISLMTCQSAILTRHGQLNSISPRT